MNKFGLQAVTHAITHNNKAKSHFVVMSTSNFVFHKMHIKRFRARSYFSFPSRLFLSGSLLGNALRIYDLISWTIEQRTYCWLLNFLALRCLLVVLFTSRSCTTRGQYFVSLLFTAPEKMKDVQQYMSQPCQGENREPDMFVPLGVAQMTAQFHSLRNCHFNVEL